MDVYTHKRTLSGDGGHRRCKGSRVGRRDASERALAKDMLRICPHMLHSQTASSADILQQGLVKDMHAAGPLNDGPWC